MLEMGGKGERKKVIRVFFYRIDKDLVVAIFFSFFFLDFFFFCSGAMVKWFDLCFISCAWALSMSLWWTKCYRWSISWRQLGNTHIRLVTHSLHSFIHPLTAQRLTMSHTFVIAALIHIGILFIFFVIRYHCIIVIIGLKGEKHFY